MSARALLGALTVALALGASAATAAAAPSLTWTKASIPSGGTPTAVSCATESLCVAVNHEGDAFTTANPNATPPTWATTAIAGKPALSAVSCAPGGPCMAVDEEGEEFASSAPGYSSWSPETVKTGAVLTGVSCPSESLCVAVDEQGDVWTNTNPRSGKWSETEFGAKHEWKAVSCASPTLCVAVDASGDLVSSTAPTGGRGGWHEQGVGGEQLLAVSCASSALCVAVGAGGEALASADPGESAPSWVLTPIDAGEPLTGVSCASSGLCVVVGEAGVALASDEAGGAIPVWSQPTSIDEENPLVGVSCLPGGLCMALDAKGNALSGRVPAPIATTLAPTQVTSTTAILAGVAEPNDAPLTGCSFEYAVGTGGTGGAYTQSVPCSVLPTAIAGRVEVSASITGLAPNTAYRFRLALATAAGSAFGAEATFVTALSSLIALAYPHPSITGTPAVGQKLTCHPGTPTGVEAQLSYAWVRDLIPIPNTGASTYTVKGQDSGHHLQCQVTATDGGGSASAKSAFVTIPVGGAPASVGETSVGRASFKQGRVSVPIVCSPHASGGCHVTLRLTAVHHLSITLASVSAHLQAGAGATVSATVGATGRRLLRAKKRFSAYLNVSGTVIGVIEAQLARELVTLTASSVHAASHRGAALASRPPVATAANAGSGILAATPYMGWDTYFALGGRYSEATILEQASQLISLGLEKRGYRYVWLDVGWWHGTRAANGEITVSPRQWPHGLAWLTRTLHAAGFRVGLYTDAGPNGCGGAGQGSYGHYQQDVNTFAAWGFDAVKVDFCGGSEHGLSPASAYSAFAQAIAHNSSHRPMLLSICNFLQPEQYGEGKPALGESSFSSYTFGPTVGNSWRTDTDVGSPGHVTFADVLRNIDADAAAPQAAGPGHWNDPDYLGPGQGMSATQFRSQLSMWAMLAAPLMISDNLEEISRASLEAVRNGEVIAIDQDPAGVQGTLLSASGNGEVWVKPLLGGSRALALLNRGSSATRITTSAGAVGLPAAPSYSLRNVWTHTTATTAGAISAEVPGDGTVLLRVSVN